MPIKLRYNIRRAIFSQDIEAVQQFIDNGQLDINKKDMDGDNILFQILKGKIPLTKSFIHNGYEYKTVMSPYTGKIWLDRNLGANRVAVSFDDEQSYGDYFQWGREADGHEKYNSDETDTISQDLTPNHSKFIITDWYNGNVWSQKQDDTLWKFGKNCPCPLGFRLATIDELKAETIDIGVKNRYDAYNNFLKLPSAGYRFCNNGALDYRGSSGNIWSSSINGKNASYLSFISDNANDYNSFRSLGQSIRCIQI